jgi:hypothetical protein
MAYITSILINLLLSLPAMSIELYRYQGVARDGGTTGNMFFEKDEQNVPKTVTKEKAAQIAAEFMTTFYHVQIGAHSEKSDSRVVLTQDTQPDCSYPER